MTYDRRFVLCRKIAMILGETIGIQWIVELWIRFVIRYLPEGDLWLIENIRQPKVVWKTRSAIVNHTCKPHSSGT